MPEFLLPKYPLFFLFKGNELEEVKKEESVKAIQNKKKKAQNVAGVPGSQSTLADSRAINPSFRGRGYYCFCPWERR